MYSAGFDHGTRFVDHGRNMLIALAMLFVVAQVPPQQLMPLAVPLYTRRAWRCWSPRRCSASRKKGATRWLDVRPMVIQPSEILKIAMPLMLAWWFQKREGQLRVSTSSSPRCCCGAGRRWSSSSPTSARRC